MILGPIHELTIVAVADAGNPDHERIAIRPTQSVNLAGFGLYLGQLKPNGMIRPYSDQFFWFGEAVVAPPSWIIVYTGPGNFQQTRMPGTGEETYVFHWGKSFTLFGIPGVVPVLFRFDGILIGSQPYSPPLLKG